jgi:hypothetical protein
MKSTEASSAESQVAKLFGLYKAEWLNGQLFDLFTEPEYFKELRTQRPCVLIGGRGTGKTTVLRGMSYEGQFALGGCNPSAIDNWTYLGIYHRVNTNRVMAFIGPELTHQQWVRSFGHYVNLVLCGHLLDFILWYSRTSSREVTLDQKSLRKVQASLHISGCSDISNLADALDEARVRFEASINNVADKPPKDLSLQGAPIDELTEAIVSLPQFTGKQFFFLIDEYENLQDYQQQVMNTIIKHARSTYTFKIGVRELGWRVRATLNASEQLRHPADYARINIHEEFNHARFRSFAERICNDRLRRGLRDSGATSEVEPTVDIILPGITSDEEAMLLGAAEHNKSFVAKLKKVATREEVEFAKAMSPSNLYLAGYWAEAESRDISDVIRDIIDRPDSWRDTYNNYMYAALFSIHRKKAGIRKYYAGWDVMTRIADGNIRYLLELVHKSLLNHFESALDLCTPISPKDQTEAAQQVGRRNLSELEGITVEGGRLTKLLLSLGRIFQVFAETPSGHTPEVNQFQLGNSASITYDTSRESDADRLLAASVMHLALVRSPGNKPLDEADTREYDYMMHPIFSPFFGFSYRRKRKLRLTSKQLLGLIEQPKVTIREVLAANNREDPEELPDQLRLFEGYYAGGL